MIITTVALDADDTLWHNESIFHLTQDHYVGLLKDYGEPDHMRARLLEVEIKNLKLYGYGVKSFTLSMIETAIDLTRGAVPAKTIMEILNLGRAMLEHPVEPLPGVAETLEALQGGYRLVMVTKGDLMNQEQKLARSGLGDFFQAIEIVSEKDANTYRRIVARQGIQAAATVMIGNSMKSDVLPALEAGLWGIHIPYHITWAHEHAEPPSDSPRFAQLESIRELPGWLAARG
ncbi:HAD family hydrolase [Dongia sp.]|uniref:HAD family hydrolase n=1 Tax=Dongia sp. TaxID=1977262 RepID=UPI003751C748